MVRHPPFQEVVCLPVQSDLSQVSFGWAIQLLGEDRPRILGGSEAQINPLCEWLWECYRGVSVVVVPQEMLKSDMHWWLEGYRRTVISQ